MAIEEWKKIRDELTVGNPVVVSYIALRLYAAGNDNTFVQRLHSLIFLTTTQHALMPMSVSSTLH